MGSTTFKPVEMDEKWGQKVKLPSRVSSSAVVLSSLAVSVDTVNSSSSLVSVAVPENIDKSMVKMILKSCLKNRKINF